MRLIGLDLGKKRVGIAFCNDQLGVVVPLDPFIVTRGLEVELDRLCNLIEEYEPGLVIVGDPVALNGSAGIAAIWAREIALAIGRRTEIAVVMVDERLSTREAARTLGEIGVHGKRQRAKVDSSAAAVILGHYLDSSRSRDDDRHQQS